MKRIFTALQAAPFIDTCESCGADTAFTGVRSAEGEGRFGTCNKCGFTEHTWVDFPEAADNVIPFPVATDEEMEDFMRIVAAVRL